MGEFLLPQRCIVFVKTARIYTMASILNSRTRRVSMSQGPKPLLSKSNSISGTNMISSSSGGHKKLGSATKALEGKAIAIVPEIVQVKREKEALEQQLAQQRKAAAESEEKNGQLSNHVTVLEELLEKKKEQLEYVESKLESMGLDPISVSEFEKDSSEERLQFLETEQKEFEERMQFLREGLETRNKLLDESLRNLQLISQDLDAL